MSNAGNAIPEPFSKRLLSPEGGNVGERSGCLTSQGAADQLGQQAASQQQPGQHRGGKGRANLPERGDRGRPDPEAEAKSGPVLGELTEADQGALRPHPAQCQSCLGLDLGHGVREGAEQHLL